MLISPKLSAMPFKIPEDALEEINKLTLKFTWKHNGPGLAKAAWKKNQVKELALPDFTIY